MAPQPLFNPRTVVNDSIGRVGTPVLPFQPQPTAAVLASGLRANPKYRFEQVLPKPEARLGLLSFVFSSPSQMDRSALLAWISEDLATDKDRAALVLSEMVLNASEKTLKNEGIDYRVAKAHQERLALFYPFLETSLDFELQDKPCGVTVRVYKTQTVGPKPMPTFIGNGGSAYGFLAGHEIQYPAFDIGCRDADPLHVIELSRRISKALPETVFVYVSPKRRAEGGWTPPMVLDHGKALLFIEPAGQDEDAPRPMVLGGSDGAAGHEDSDQGADS